MPEFIGNFNLHPGKKLKGSPPPNISPYRGIFGGAQAEAKKVQVDWKIEIAWPPSVNHIWRKTPAGRIYLTREARIFRADVMSRVAVARCHGALPKTALAGNLAVAMELYPPDRRRRDVDNYSKAVLDALTHARIWRDDSQIKRQTVTVRESKAGGQVVLTISALEDE